MQQLLHPGLHEQSLGAEGFPCKNDRVVRLHVRLLLSGSKISKQETKLFPPITLLPLLLNWCSLSRNLHWKDAPVSMTPTIKWLLELGLPVWLYRYLVP